MPCVWIVFETRLFVVGLADCNHPLKVELGHLHSFPPNAKEASKILVFGTGWQWMLSQTERTIPHVVRLWSECLGSGKLCLPRKMDPSCLAEGTGACTQALPVG